MYGRYILSDRERLRPAPNLPGDIAVVAAGPPYDHVSREAAGLVKIRAGCPGMKKGTVHTRSGRARWCSRNQRENRWYTAARLNPIFSPPSIYEIYRWDKGSLCPRARRSFSLHPFLWNEARFLRAASESGRSSRETEQHRPNERKSGLANLWVPAAASARRFTARYINGWFHPPTSVNFISSLTNASAAVSNSSFREKRTIAIHVIDDILKFCSYANSITPTK